LVENSSLNSRDNFAAVSGPGSPFYFLAETIKEFE